MLGMFAIMGVFALPVVVTMAIAPGMNRRYDRAQAARRKGVSQK